MLFSDVSTDPSAGADDWYAIYVNPNCERRVAHALTGKGFESYLPLCWQYRNWSNRVRKVERALMPGYVFSRFCSQKRLPILTVPGVVYIVGTRSGPTPVDPDELAAVRQVAESSRMAEPWPFLAAGKLVTLEYGPLRGVTGRLISAGSGLKVVVSISLLQRSVAVEVDRSWVSPVNEGRFRPALAATA